MAKLTLHIVADNKLALQGIKQVGEAADQLSNKTIKIKVESSGLDKLTKEEKQALEAVAKLTNAEARKMSEDRKATAELEKKAAAEAKAGSAGK